MPHEDDSLFKVAVSRFHRPKYVITDLAAEFKGTFKRTVKRFGCTHSPFWRTLKNLIGYEISFP